MNQNSDKSVSHTVASENRTEAPQRDDPPRVIESEELLRGADEVLIQHGGDLYRLRRTRQGKLILNK